MPALKQETREEREMRLARERAGRGILNRIEDPAMRKASLAELERTGIAGQPYLNKQAQTEITAQPDIPGISRAGILQPRDQILPKKADPATVQGVQGVGTAEPIVPLERHEKDVYRTVKGKNGKERRVLVHKAGDIKEGAFGRQLDTIASNKSKAKAEAATKAPAKAVDNASEEIGDTSREDFIAKQNERLAKQEAGIKARRVLANTPFVTTMAQIVGEEVDGFSADDAFSTVKKGIKELAEEGREITAENILDKAKIKGADIRQEKINKLKLNVEENKLKVEEAKFAEKLESGQFGDDGSALDSAATNELQKKYSDISLTIGDVARLANNLDLDAFTYGGQFDESLATVKDKLKVSNPGDKALLDRRKVQTQIVNRIFQKWRKTITGAQASEKELEDLKKSVLNEDLSPAQAKASIRDLMVQMLRDQLTIQSLLKDGIDISKATDPEKAQEVFSDRQLKVQLDMAEQLESLVISQFPNLASEDQLAELERSWAQIQSGQVSSPQNSESSGNDLRIKLGGVF